MVVYNPEHSPARRANDVVHELSHVLRKHPPRPAIGFGGCREWDNRYEGEADWLSGALLVPRSGAFVLVRQGGTIQDGADRFGVSVDLFRWRAHMTGVVRVVELLRAS
jgi:Zn-dependent peptidase ImmA (M78 family)